MKPYKVKSNRLIGFATIIFCAVVTCLLFELFKWQLKTYSAADTERVWLVEPIRISLWFPYILGAWLIIGRIAQAITPVIIRIIEKRRLNRGRRRFMDSIKNEINDKD